MASRVPTTRPERLTAALLGLALAVAAPPAVAQVTFLHVTPVYFRDGLSNGHYLWGDCDGDGDIDLLVGGKTLYLNDGPPDFRFSRLTDTGELGAGPHSRALWIDIDNDGDLDLFGIGSGDNERLYENDGSCSFTDISDFNHDGDFTDMGDGAPSTTASTGDLDGDGFLDLYVGNYERNCGGSPVICGDCMTDRLWRNLGDNTFEDITVPAGIYAQEHAITGFCYVGRTPCTSDADCAPFPADSCVSGTCARGSNWVDYDNDGDQDIFVSNYRLHPNLLWENDGFGSFTEVAEAHNVDGDEDSGAWGHVLGSDWADYDNDGDMDLYTANLAHSVWVVQYGHDISQLLENLGPPGFDFVDVRESSGMRAHSTSAQPDWAETHPAWADYDNDGDLDIYVTHIYDSSNLNFSTLYSNDGDKTFTETTAAHGTDLGLFKNYSAGWCDFDRDGDLDLVTYGAPERTGSSTARLYRNEGGSDNAWLQLRVWGKATTPGTGSNRFGVGVRVSVSFLGNNQLREVQGGFGYHTAMSSMPLEFGFGTAPPTASFDSMTIRWTTGESWDFEGQPLHLHYTAWERIKIGRGPDCSVDPLPELVGGLFPYHDLVLSDGQTHYYRLEGTEGDETLAMVKQPERGFAVLTLK